MTKKSRLKFKYQLPKIVLDLKVSLNEYTKFSKLEIPAGKEINHITYLKKGMISKLKSSENKEIYTWLVYLYKRETKANLHIVLQMK